jgi:hypothetical protein
MSEQFVTHSFESLFDIEEGTTIIEQDIIPVVHNSECELYDNKDSEIEEQYQIIFNAALQAYSNQIVALERGGDPATNHKVLDVANNFLKTALDSTKAKAELKKSKDKNIIASSTKNVTNNNLIIDRNELLKQLLKD